MGEPFDILLLEDSPSQARLLELAVERRPDLHLVAHAETVAEAVEMLGRIRVDVVLSDLMVPDSSGIETVEALRAAAPDVALVVVSSAEAPELLEGAMRVGAQDYLIKRGAIDGAEVARVVRNAVERHRLARSLARSETRYRGLLEHASDAIVIADGGGRIVEVNERACDMLGYSRAELLGVRDTTLFRVDGAEGGGPADPDLDGFAAIAAGANLQEGALATASGCWLPVEVSARRMGDGSVQVIARDVSDRKRARELEEDRRAVLEHIVGQRDRDGSLDAVLEMVARQIPPAEVFLIEHGVGDQAMVPRPPVHVGRGVEPAARAAAVPGAVTDDDRYAAEWAAVLEQRPAVVAEPAGGLAYAVPVVTGGGEVWGTVSLRLPAGTEVDARTEAVATEAARLTALAVDHHSLIRELERQALHDGLTGLPNRALMEDRLSLALADAERKGAMVAVFFIDLDNFKKVNDTLGHHAGDELLRRVGTRLRECMRRKDTVARIGGDEFAVVVADVEASEQAMDVARKILAEFEKPLQLAGRDVYVTTTIGVSVFPRDGQDREDLLRKADHAMYRAKRGGQSHFQFYGEDMTSVALDRLAIEAELRVALATDQLRLHFQPIVPLAGAGARGMRAEALLRWEHPTRGLLAPGAFIPTIERTGLIAPVGAWVLEEACRQQARWRASGRAPDRVCVNVSALQFARAEFFSTVVNVVRGFDLEPGELELEITESVVMHDVDVVAGRLAAIRDLGVRVAIDDFGTGYSSLSYLQRLPFDVLKIDRAFIDAMARKERGSRELVQAVITLGRGLGVEITAEGVEDPSLLPLLRDMGCDFVQGYVVGRPSTAERFVDQLVVDVAAHE